MSRARAATLVAALCFGGTACRGTARPAAIIPESWSPRQCVTDTLAVRQGVARVSTLDPVSRGITYQCLLDGRGPWVMHVVSVDLRTPGIEVDAERGNGTFLGRERVSRLAERRRGAGDALVVAINADFFNLYTGEVVNSHVERGEWVKGVMVRDPSRGGAERARSQFAVDERGRPLIGRFELRGAAVVPGLAITLAGINHRLAGSEGLVLYTPRFGTRTPPLAEAAGGSAELALRRAGRRGDSTLYRVVPGGLLRTGGGKTIPPDGAVLSATGSAVAALEREASAGKEIRVVSQIAGWDAPIRASVGGWARLLLSGENVGVRADSLEGTAASFSSARHPRTAVGFSRDSTRLILMVVDGRRPWSVGMSLGELSDAMRDLGAHDAVNLDGGGSTTLWVLGQVVNRPSDATGERPVGNALVVRMAGRRAGVGR